MKKIINKIKIIINEYLGLSFVNDRFEQGKQFLAKQIAEVIDPINEDNLYPDPDEDSIIYDGTTTAIDCSDPLDLHKHYLLKNNRISFALQTDKTIKGKCRIIVQQIKDNNNNNENNNLVVQRRRAVKKVDNEIDAFEINLANYAVRIDNYIDNQIKVNAVE